MPEIKEVKPSYDGSPSAASYYFYSEYDPATHFEYKIAFEKDGININSEEYVKNKLAAYRKVIEHHFSFEQVLPKEATDFITFYRPNYTNYSPLDYNFKFENITQKNFEDNLKTAFNTPIILKIPTKSDYISNIATSTLLEKDYSEMTMEELKNLYLYSKHYIDATNINKHAYACANYCQICRPIKVDDQGQPIHEKDKDGKDIPNKYEYVSPYEFRKYIRLINSIFNFKLPVEEGWYKYNKETKKWEYIQFKQEVTG